MTDYVINYQAEFNEVKSWLMNNIPYHRLTKYEYSAVDLKNRFVWRMNLTGRKQVLFNDKDYAMLFALTWT